MLVEVKCPECGKKYFLDVLVKGLETITFQREEEIIQFVAESIKVKSISSSVVILENL
ncbi:MAG TPA: hypothetical protein HA262_04415 [Methanosarcina sp.]|jgi:hypothetical protein|nr:hypothetical protein [Methanosarcina sp.]